MPRLRPGHLLFKRATDDAATFAIKSRMVLSRRAMGEQEHRIETGRRVRLRTGGPVMEVLATSETMAHCSWMQDGGRVQQATFDKRGLGRVEADDSDGTPSL